MARQGAEVADDIAARLAQPIVDLIGVPPAGWTCGIYTLWIAGELFGRSGLPTDADQAAELRRQTKALPAHA